MFMIVPRFGRLFFFLILLLVSCRAYAGIYYVSVTGTPQKGDGSIRNPWASLSEAILRIPDDGSTVFVLDGTYEGLVALNRRFTHPTTFKAMNAYRAVLVNSSTTTQVITIFGGANITVEGFEIMRPDPRATGTLMMQIQTAKKQHAQNIIIRNNIIHDSFNNDLLKINNVSDHILVERNIFYNQSGPDEHIDINAVSFVTVQDNIFFNDFAGSKRPKKETGSFIVIKNSSGKTDTRNIVVRRNVFLNWEGSSAKSFVMVGEDGKDYFEAQDVLIENNLMLGNSMNRMLAPFSVSGGKNITFRNNTVSGKFHSRAIGASLSRIKFNPKNRNIRFYNNVWSNSSDTPAILIDGEGSETRDSLLHNNLYYNISENPVVDKKQPPLRISDDPGARIGDALLPDPRGLILPRWNPLTFSFLSGSSTIREEFERLVMLYGIPGPGSPAFDSADTTNAAVEDILGQRRYIAPDLGAFETLSGQPVILQPTSLAAGFIDTSYSQTISASGNIPVEFLLASGALPDGLSLSASGMVSGMPSRSGLFKFTIVSRETNNRMTGRDYSIEISSCRIRFIGLHVISECS